MSSHDEYRGIIGTLAGQILEMVQHNKLTPADRKFATELVGRSINDALHVGQDATEVSDSLASCIHDREFIPYLKKGDSDGER